MKLWYLGDVRFAQVVEVHEGVRLICIHHDEAVILEFIEELEFSKEAFFAVLDDYGLVLALLLETRVLIFFVVGRETLRRDLLIDEEQLFVEVFGALVEVGGSKVGEVILGGEGGGQEGFVGVDAGGRTDREVARRRIVVRYLLVALEYVEHTRVRPPILIRVTLLVLVANGRHPDVQPTLPGQVEFFLEAQGIRGSDAKVQLENLGEELEGVLPGPIVSRRDQGVIDVFVLAEGEYGRVGGVVETCLQVESGGIEDYLFVVEQTGQVEIGVLEVGSLGVDLVVHQEVLVLFELL